jgi:hypothetical protein
MYGVAKKLVSRSNKSSEQRVLEVAIAAAQVQYDFGLFLFECDYARTVMVSVDPFNTPEQANHMNIVVLDLYFFWKEGSYFNRFD